MTMINLWPLHYILHDLFMPGYRSSHELYMFVPTRVFRVIRVNSFDCVFSVLAVMYNVLCHHFELFCGVSFGTVL